MQNITHVKVEPRNFIEKLDLYMSIYSIYYQTEKNKYGDIRFDKITIIIHYLHNS